MSNLDRARALIDHYHTAGAAAETMWLSSVDPEILAALAGAGLALRGALQSGDGIGAMIGQRMVVYGPAVTAYDAALRAALAPEPGA